MSQSVIEHWRNKFGGSAIAKQEAQRSNLNNTKNKKKRKLLITTIINIRNKIEFREKSKRARAHTHTRTRFAFAPRKIAIVIVSVNSKDAKSDCFAFLPIYFGHHYAARSIEQKCFRECCSIGRSGRLLLLILCRLFLRFRGCCVVFFRLLIGECSLRIRDYHFLVRFILHPFMRSVAAILALQYGESERKKDPIINCIV